VEYRLEIRTIAGIDDPDFIERLAELLYDRDDLFLGLVLTENDDASVSASFGAQGLDPLEVARVALEEFAFAVVKAEPAHGLGPGELTPGAAAVAETVDSFSVGRAAEDA
jgi:hypothetical protein